MRARLIRNGSWKLYAACDEQGDAPLLEFIRSLEEKPRSQALALLNRLAERNPSTFRPEICHQLRDDIWQFRSGDVRLLWFYQGRHIIVFSHGFVKKSDKTPLREITKAQEAQRALKDSPLNEIGT